jgi:cytochrome c556
MLATSRFICSPFRKRKTMKLSRYSRAFSVASCITLANFGVNQMAHADEPENAMVLRTVMQQLERDMQSVTAAISREEWLQVFDLAPEIGSHAEPPLTEKVRILAWLGTDASKFRGFDKKTHDAATAMGEAAAKSDGQEVIAEFAKLQQGCLACHQNFRSSFKAHFYGPK